MDATFYTPAITVISGFIEAAGVFAIFFGMLLATVFFVTEWMARRDMKKSFKSYRQNLGRAILLGLEFLIAGDIISTVLVTQTFKSVGTLAALILIRTFLAVELEHKLDGGRWPWQRA